MIIKSCHDVITIQKTKFKIFTKILIKYYILKLFLTEQFPTLLTETYKTSLVKLKKISYTVSKQNLFSTNDFNSMLINVWKILK